VNPWRFLPVSLAARFQEKTPALSSRPQPKQRPAADHAAFADPKHLKPLKVYPCESVKSVAVFEVQLFSLPARFQETNSPMVDPALEDGCL
jgi:hypothetical protein